MRSKVLEIVADKTGYPPDMLDLDLDLEADLGIDTVKQAETFAAIREAWDIPRDDTMPLRDYPTLAHAIQFVYDKRPDLERPTAAATGDDARGSAGTDAAPPPARGHAEVADDPVRTKVLEIVAEKTGYPPDMLDLDLDLEADLGIDTVKQAETFAAIRAAWDIPRDDTMALRDYPTLAHAIQFVYDKRPDLERPTRRGHRRRRPPAAPTPAAARAAAQAAADGRRRSARRSSRSSPTRPATRRTCSTWTWTSRPTSASTPSSRPRPSPPSAPPGTSPATTPWPCATTPPWPTPSSSSTTSGPTWRADASSTPPPTTRRRGARGRRRRGSGSRAER